MSKAKGDVCLRVISHGTLIDPICATGVWQVAQFVDQENICVALCHRKISVQSVALMDDICRHVFAVHAHARRVVYCCNSDRHNFLPDQIWIYICDDFSHNRHSDDDRHVQYDDVPFHQPFASSMHQMTNLMTARAQLDGHALGPFSCQASRIRAHILPSEHDEVCDRQILLV